MTATTPVRLGCGALLAAVVVGSFSPFAPIVYLATPVVVLGVVGFLVLRRDFVMALEVGVWCWLVSPFVRRVVELRVGYHEPNLVLFAPVVAAVPIGVACLFVRCRLPRGVVLGLAAVVGALTIGVSLGATQLPPTAVAAGLTAWAPPLVLGVGFLLLPMERTSLVALLGRVGVYGCLVVGVYGVVQWLVAPVWDTTWLVNVSDVANSFGYPRPRAIRVFSTLNSAGPASAALTFCIVAASVSRFPTWVKAVAISAALACIGLTEVRQAYLTLVLLAFFALAKGVYPARVLLVAAVAVVVVVLAVPAAYESVGTRVSSSAQAGGADQSLNARLSFQRAQAGEALARPVGLGIGSTGSGARTSTTSDAFGNADSGYLELLRTFGALVTLLFLGGVVALARVPAYLSPRVRGDDVAVALHCLVLTLPVQLFLGNVFTGSSAAVMWVAVFASVRLGLQRPDVDPDVDHDREPVVARDVVGQVA